MSVTIYSEQDVKSARWENGVNMSNGNWAAIAFALGIASEDVMDGETTSEDMIARIEIAAALGTDVQAERPTVRAGNQTIFGIDEDYVSHKISQIRTLCIPGSKVIWY